MGVRSDGGSRPRWTGRLRTGPVGPWARGPVVRSWLHAGAGGEEIPGHRALRGRGGWWASAASEGLAGVLAVVEVDRGGA